MTPSEVTASYRQSLDTLVTIRRYSGAGINRPRFDAAVQARVTGYAPAELVDGIQQGDRKVIVLADDLLRAQFSLPLKRGDKVVLRGAELNIEAADDSTRRVGGELIAIEIRARG